MTVRWIVGLDGSDAALDALRWAVRHAGGRDVEITALQAYHVPAMIALLGAKRGFGVDQLGMAATAGHQVDEAIAHVGDTGGVAVEPLVVEGQAAHELVEASAGAALLVVGRRGEGGLLRHVVGSVSRYCATHSASPVVIVPTDWTVRDTASVAVGFDGSEQATAALRWALDFAPATAAIRVVAAIEVAPWLDQGLTQERFPDDVRREERRLMEAIELVDPGHRAERDVVLNSPRQALAEASATTDLIVVGSRGRGGMAAGLLGSVSTSVIHGTECPVAVVPG
jgi:nucleotide-binding universal stress UspA family protein